MVPARFAAALSCALAWFGLACAPPPPAPPARGDPGHPSTAGDAHPGDEATPAGDAFGPGDETPSGDLASAPVVSCIADIPAALAAVPTDGTRLALWSGRQHDGQSLLPWPSYTNTVENGLGFNNHFQSVVRLGSRHVAISGSSVGTGVGHLFVATRGDGGGEGRWGSNLSPGPHPDDAMSTTEQPPGADRVVARIDVDLDRWHPGGLAIFEDILVAPVHGGGSSRIRFFDAGDPEDPVALPIDIDRPDSNADAAGLTRLADDRLLLGMRTATQYDFYVSNSTDIADGFATPPTRWDIDGPFAFARALANHQNIALFTQCDGALYMVGWRHNAPLSGMLPGRNKAYLYEVHFPDDDPTQIPDIEEVADRRFDCVGTWCNFDAGVGAHVTPHGELVFYAVPHYRRLLTGYITGEETIIPVVEY